MRVPRRGSRASGAVEFDGIGQRWTGDLAALDALLTAPVPGAGKFACPFFLVGAFAGDRRHNAGFERASVVALDVENGVSTREAHARFVGAHHVIYTTWRHTTAEQRFRLVLPLGRDVDAREYKLLWVILARRLGSGADPQTKDLARALFLPALRPDGGSSVEPHAARRGREAEERLVDDEADAGTAHAATAATVGRWPSGLLGRPTIVASPATASWP